MAIPPAGPRPVSPHLRPPDPRRDDAHRAPGRAPPPAHHLGDRLRGGGNRGRRLLQPAPRHPPAPLLPGQPARLQLLRHRPARPADPAGRDGSLRGPDPGLPGHPVAGVAVHHAGPASQTREALRHALRHRLGGPLPLRVRHGLLRLPPRPPFPERCRRPPPVRALEPDQLPEPDHADDGRSSGSPSSSRSCWWPSSWPGWSPRPSCSTGGGGQSSGSRWRPPSSPRARTRSPCSPWPCRWWPSTSLSIGIGKLLGR